MFKDISMTSPKGLVFQVLPIGKNKITIELFDLIKELPLGEKGEKHEEFIDRCITEISSAIDEFAREFATSS